MTVPTPTDQWLKKADYDAFWTPQGGIGTTIDPFGNEIYGPSDGSNDALVPTTTPEYFNDTNTSGVTQVSTSCWFKMSSAALVNGFPFTQNRNAADQHIWFLSIAETSQNGVIQFSKGAGPTSLDFQQAATTSKNYADDILHHLVAVWDLNAGTEVIIYVDGVAPSQIINDGPNGSF